MQDRERHVQGEGGVSQRGVSFTAFGSLLTPNRLVSRAPRFVQPHSSHRCPSLVLLHSRHIDVRIFTGSHSPHARVLS